MNIRDFFLDLIYPPRCPFCRNLLRDNEADICARCLRTLPFVPPDEQPVSYPFIKLCVAPLYYEGSVRDSLLRYKFGGVTAYKKAYADLLSKCIDENNISCDIITWVPLSRKRLQRRGYDQARLLAEDMADTMAVPCERLLNKVRDNPPQSGTSGVEMRRKNVIGVYTCASETALENKRVLIIDDIVTTGSTLKECARMLLAAGADVVYTAAVARSHN